MSFGVSPPPGGSISFLPDYSDTTDPGRGVTGIDAADRLQQIIEHAQGWPIWQSDRVGGVDTGTYPQVGMYGKSLRDIALWVALRENDREAIIQLTNWEKDRPLHIDPMAQRITESFSGMLYGEEPDFIASTDTDQPKMDEMAEETGLADELSRWSDIRVSEGEVWWRGWTDLDASEWPLISGHSRLNVLPLFVGRKIVAVAFFDNLFTQELTVERQVRVIFWRHVEIHTVGYVRNLLYRGTVGTLGQQMPLNTLMETKDLDEDWDHGLPVMLAGRIPYKIGRDFRVGVSAFQGVRDLIMDLNEARTIMAENARLVLKARMVVPANAVDSEGNFDASQDIVVAESLDEELAGKTGGPYTVLEYNFRAGELIEHKNELTLDIMSRVGLAEQFATSGGKGGGAQAFTGTALRTRLVPTIQAGKVAAKGDDREVPKILKSLALLSQLSVEKGGCGQSWSDAGGKHLMKRATMLPEDPNEKVQRHVMAVQGEVESVETAVRDIHADDGWDDEAVELEVGRIRRDRSEGPTYAEDLDDLEEQETEDEETNTLPPPPGTPGGPNIPNVPPGGPGSSVDTPSDVVGSTQPGVRRPVDGQSPGKQAPQVRAGGPR